MSSGVLVRQPLARGESHRAESVLARMHEVDGVTGLFQRLGVHLSEARLGRSSSGPYVYYRIEADREGDLAGRYRALVDAVDEETDAVAEVVVAFDHLTAGEPQSAEFGTRAGEETDASRESSTGHLS